MLQSKSKRFKTNVGDVEITVTQLPAMRSGKLLMRIGKSVGPALAGVAGAIDPKSEKPAIGDPGALPAAVRSLFETLDGDELEYLTRELLSSAQAKHGGEFVDVLDVFDLWFAGRVVEWFALLWFAFEVNFGNFTDALGAFMRPFVAKAAATPSS